MAHDILAAWATYLVASSMLCMTCLNVSSGYYFFALGLAACLLRNLELCDQMT
jgi:hypothetical protein